MKEGRKERKRDSCTMSSTLYERFIAVASDMFSLLKWLLRESFSWEKPKPFDWLFTSEQRLAYTQTHIHNDITFLS